jgi:hypothetical protein
MTVLVAGGSGYIGQATVRALKAHSDYPLQALLYSVVLHRFLRWRQPGHDPSRHLRGVFNLRPPVEPVTALPDLLATGERAAWVSTLTRSGRGLWPGCPGGGLDAGHIGAQE